jgi:ubiquinone/menaquinone biosynthesis C-methylase UbiE
VFAVDIVPEFIERIESRAKERGMANVTPVLCKEDSVELPPASVDLAFLSDTYHHFEYPRSSLRSIHCALRSGGELVVIDFKRLEGVSRQWVLDHVRAGEEVVTKEIIAAGFERLPGPSEKAFLKENYFLRFRKKGP